MFASVVLDFNIEKPLDYRIPPLFENGVKTGMRVSVSLKKRQVFGTIIALKQEGFKEALPLLEIFPELSIPNELLQFGLWLADYYCAPLPKVFSLLFPSPIRKGVSAKKQLYIQSNLSINQLAKQCAEKVLKKPSQAKILECLLKYPKGLLLTELLEKSKVSKAPLQALIQEKVLRSYEMEVERSSSAQFSYFLTSPKTLNAEQEVAFLKIQKDLKEERFETHLLFGVTGSGKTEIYLQAIKETLLLQKTAIFLVPEIALTPQTMQHLKTRFSEKIAILHHRLSEGERRDMWHQMQGGNIPIVVGARSALFSPLPRLGLIIVDEEHDSSYKSEEVPCFSARDGAIMRAKGAEAVVILGSATPSFETFFNAQKAKYCLSFLKKRASGAQSPQFLIVDMEKEFEKNKGFTLFSAALIQAIEKRKKQGEQTLLFLNRRGYHSLQMCQSCSKVVECPHCDLALTYHLSSHLLACHLCNYQLTPPQACPSCNKSETMKYKGVGTEMVEKSLQALIPSIRTLRLDADTTRHKASHELIFKQFRAGKADVLIGTQMIAKGLHFPSVTLVGIIHADSALYIPDFRASEQLFQLLVQVAGRSGRGLLPGEVVIQTRLPTHSVILKAAENQFEEFYAEEMQARKLLEYPPYAHFAKLVFSSIEEDRARETAENLRTFLVQELPSSFFIFPVVRCGREKIRDHWRFQFLVRGNHFHSFRKILIHKPKLHPKVRFKIDIDPLTIY
jgi:primosomal protein N' (replication factor Y) (superfamily II helicase)